MVVVAAVVFRGWTSQWIPIDLTPDVYLGVMVGALALPLGYAAAQLYPGYGLTAVERLRRRALVSTFGFGALILFDYLAQKGQWSRGVLLTAGALSVFVIPLWDALAVKFLIRRRLWGESVVVFGTPEQRRAVLASLAANRALGWVPVAEADLTEIGDSGHPPADLALVVSTDLAVVEADEMPYRRIVVIPQVTGIQSQWVVVRDLGAQMGLEMHRNLLIRRNQLLKRAIDLVAGAVLMVVLAPIVAIAAALVATVSPGPVFYTQVRLGRDGKPFRIVKLRTMVPDAEARLDAVIAGSPEASSSWDRTMKIPSDPRIVPWVGEALRRWSIDELPQFWNVVRGEMSLVGPRPLPPYHAERFAEVTNRLRQRVRPGITGLWQVSGRSLAGLEDQQQLDVYYVRNWSLWLDILILARTMVVVLIGKGAW